MANKMKKCENLQRIKIKRIFLYHLSTVRAITSVFLYIHCVCVCAYVFLSEKKQEKPLPNQYKLDCHYTQCFCNMRVCSVNVK